MKPLAMALLLLGAACGSVVDEDPTQPASGDLVEWIPDQGTAIAVDGAAYVYDVADGPDCEGGTAVHHYPALHHLYVPRDKASGDWLFILEAEGATHHARGTLTLIENSSVRIELRLDGELCDLDDVCKPTSGTLRMTGVWAFTEITDEAYPSHSVVSVPSNLPLCHYEP